MCWCSCLGYHDRVEHPGGRKNGRSAWVGWIQGDFCSFKSVVLAFTRAGKMVPVKIVPVNSHNEFSRPLVEKKELRDWTRTVLLVRMWRLFYKWGRIPRHSFDYSDKTCRLSPCEASILSTGSDGSRRKLQAVGPWPAEILQTWWENAETCSVDWSWNYSRRQNP